MGETVGETTTENEKPKLITRKQAGHSKVFDSRGIDVTNYPPEIREYKGIPTGEVGSIQRAISDKISATLGDDPLSAKAVDFTSTHAYDKVFQACNVMGSAKRFDHLGLKITTPAVFSAKPAAKRPVLTISQVLFDTWAYHTCVVAGSEILSVNNRTDFSSIEEFAVYASYLKIFLLKLAVPERLFRENSRLKMENFSRWQRPGLAQAQYIPRPLFTEDPFKNHGEDLYRREGRGFLSSYSVSLPRAN